MQRFVVVQLLWRCPHIRLNKTIKATTAASWLSWASKSIPVVLHEAVYHGIQCRSGGSDMPLCSGTSWNNFFLPNSPIKFTERGKSSLIHSFGLKSFQTYGRRRSGRLCKNGGHVTFRGRWPEIFLTLRSFEHVQWLCISPSSKSMFCDWTNQVFGSTFQLWGASLTDKIIKYKVILQWINDTFNYFISYLFHLALLVLHSRQSMVFAASRLHPPFTSLFFHPWQR